MKAIKPYDHAVRRCAWMTIFVGAVLLAGCGESTPAGGSAPHSQAAPHSQNEPAADHDKHEDHDDTGHGGQGDHGGHENNRLVTLTDEQRAQLDIVVAQATPASVAQRVQAPGTLVFDADRVARVGPRLQSKVVSVTHDLGDVVASGDTLAVLDSVALGKHKAAYLTARARTNTRRAAYDRDRRLARDQIVAESAVAESRAAYQQSQAELRAERAELRLYGLSDRAIDDVAHGDDALLSRLELVAPRAGVIAQRDLLVGETLDANATPIHIVDTSELWLMIDAAEQALPQLASGQAATFTVRPLPGRVFPARVDWISPKLDTDARTVQLRAIVPNPDGCCVPACLPRWLFRPAAGPMPRA